MKWENIGLIFKPSGENESLQSHCSMPIGYHLEEDRFRFYFSSRDSNNSSSINYVEVNIDQPSKILFLSKRPDLRKGPYGHFDDNGLYSGSLIKYKEKKRKLAFCLVVHKKEIRKKRLNKLFYILYLFLRKFLSLLWTVQQKALQLIRF